MKECKTCGEKRTPKQFLRLVDGRWLPTRECCFCLSKEAIKDWNRRIKRKGFTK